MRLYHCLRNVTRFIIVFVFLVNLMSGRPSDLVIVDYPLGEWNGRSGISQQLGKLVVTAPSARFSKTTVEER